MLQTGKFVRQVSNLLARFRSGARLRVVAALGHRREERWSEPLALTEGLPMY